MNKAFLGVDVGTGSARAGVFDATGGLLASSTEGIKTWYEEGAIAEQSSDDIWLAVCRAVRAAVSSSGLVPEDVGGIGFDATCSLVGVGSGGRPVTLSRSGDPQRNIIVWMDHRAIGEADRISAGRYDVLRYVGGRMSPEMETPKLLWLKNNLPQAYAAVSLFFDLADYLTWRATGSEVRSSCTTTCKWTYLAHERRWDEAYFRAIGLEDLVEESFRKIGTQIVAPGTPLGRGLTKQAAEELGLSPGTAAAAALIDAHAGGVGTLGATLEGDSVDVTKRLAYVFGTSACSMASTQAPTFVEGVWGPYFSAMIPGLWLNEGGQSAAGSAIDHLVHMHSASAAAAGEAAQNGLSLVDYLEKRIRSGLPSLSDAVLSAGSIHVVPEFLGNRSPLADPNARAIIAGLDLENGFRDLASLYVAGLCGLGYGLRQLIQAFRDRGVQIDLVIASGGAARSPLVLQVIADAIQVSVASPATGEPVLLGAAMLGAVAAGQHGSIQRAMPAMSGIQRVFVPCDERLADVHRRRYEAFLLLQHAGRAVRMLS